MRALRHILLATSMLVAGAMTARADEPPVKIGAIFPLTGASASQGDSERDAILVAAEVIKIGRSRVAAPSTMAWNLSRPCSCNVLANSTMRMPFFDTNPTSVTNPTLA